MVYYRHLREQSGKGIKYRHTWNIVRINGQYYHLDATFDNTLGKNEDGLTSIRYDYFNLDDKNIFRDHEPLIAPAPPCPDGNHFYYREKKLSFTKLEDVYKRALQAAKKAANSPSTGEADISPVKSSQTL